GAEAHRRLRPGSEPHSNVAFPWGGRQHRGATARRAAVRIVEGRRRPRAVLALPGSEARLLDPDLPRARIAEVVVVAPRGSTRASSFRGTHRCSSPSAGN